MGSCLLSKSFKKDYFYPVGSVYFSVNNTNPSILFGFGTWELIGSKLAVSENVFGNGYGLALTAGDGIGTMRHAPNQWNLNPSSGFGKLIGANVENQSITPLGKNIGVPTKAKLGTDTQKSGLIVDTETIYSWKRTA